MDLSLCFLLVAIVDVTRRHGFGCMQMKEEKSFQFFFATDL
jgi:hypothetical protein